MPDGKVGGRDNVNGLGIGAPNGNYYNGSIEYAVNLPWKDDRIPLAEMFQRKLGVSVTVTNDANAAAIGEMTNLDSFVMEIFIE